MQIPDIDLFGLGARFHHVGIAVPSIDQAVPGLTKFLDPIQRVTVAFANLHGQVVELIEPAGENSPVQASLKKRINLVHLCYTVPNIAQAIAHAEPNGVMRMTDPVPAVAFEGKPIAWVFHPVFGLIELLETGE